MREEGERTQVQTCDDAFGERLRLSCHGGLVDPQEWTALSAVIQAGATVLLLAVTGVYVWFTARIAQESRSSAASAERAAVATERSMRAQTLPLLVLDVNPMPVRLTPEGDVVEASEVPYVLQNLGVAPAFNVSLFMVPTEGGTATPTDDISFGIQYGRVIPGERIEGRVFGLFPMGQSSGSKVENPQREFRRRLLEEDWEVVAEFEDPLGHKYQCRRNFGIAAGEWMNVRTLRLERDIWVPLVEERHRATELPGAAR